MGKVELSWVIFGFGITYMFFGLGQVLYKFPEWVILLTGGSAIFIGIFFVVLACSFFTKK